MFPKLLHLLCCSSSSLNYILDYHISQYSFISRNFNHFDLAYFISLFNGLNEVVKNIFNETKYKESSKDKKHNSNKNKYNS